MSKLGETTLIQHLVDADSIAVLAQEGIPADAIPTEELRPIIGWAVDYFFRSGRTRAPSVEALRAVEHGQSTFGDIIDDNEIPLGEEPEDSIEFALDDLRSSYVYRQTQTFNRDFASQMAEASSDERLEVLAAAATDLVSLSISLVRKDTAVDIRESMGESLFDYEARAENAGIISGMQFGLEAVDSHIYGIQPGELAIMAAGPKTGKSFMLAWVALKEWERGRSACLFTLENSVALTKDRIACMAVGVDSMRWQRGQCLPEEVEAVREWITDLEKSDTPLWIVQPDLGRRSIEHMVREAQVREVESLLIDQLTFVELPSERKPKHERIGEALHTLKGLISTGRDRMSTMMAHQINRDGVKAAEKVGYLEMYHMAEAAEVERTADIVVGAYASRDDLVAYRLKLQLLAARRVPLNAWDLDWMPFTGNINVRQEIALSS